MTDIAALLAGCRIMPVVTIDNAADAVPIARALRDGGLRALEVVLRTPAALAAIRSIADGVPELILGAGTVLNAADLAASRAAGARFAIAPGSTPALLAAARSAGMAFLPAVATASELMLGLEQGYTCFKLFPAALLGSATLRALRGPFPDARFCATGGISPDNAAQFLAEPNVFAVGVSWVTPAEAIRSADWGRIRELAGIAAALQLTHE
jgi:2-dehydro-3-deoxyphosphogluconate aldolase/(4S)-4-hydroxy-2-oxoglutarate aldolase